LMCSTASYWKLEQPDHHTAKNKNPQRNRPGAMELYKWHLYKEFDGSTKRNRVYAKTWLCSTHPWHRLGIKPFKVDPL